MSLLITSLLAHSSPSLLGSEAVAWVASTTPSPSALALLADPLFAQAAEGGGPSLLSFLPIIAMGVLMYFLFIVPQRAKDKRFQQMLEGLKENDHVVTTGGLHGVVTNVQRDAGRLTLRIDEANGTKIKVAMWAIDSVASEDK